MPVELKCRCCHEFFSPSKYARERQRFCAREGCRKASKAQAQRRWQDKPQNRDYFCGATHVERVRRWREQHPGYSRRPKRSLAEEPLQDLAPPQKAAREELAQELVPPPAGGSPREPEGGAPGRPPLQDLALGEHPLIVGLISMFTGEALQETVADVARGLVERGRRVLAQESKGSGRHGAFATANSS